MKTDWFAIIAEINRHGINMSQIEVYTEIDRQKLMRYRAGTEPRYEDGLILIGFWSSITGKPQESAPKEREHISASRARVLTR